MWVHLRGLTRDFGVGMGEGMEKGGGTWDGDTWQGWCPGEGGKNGEESRKMGVWFGCNGDFVSLGHRVVCVVPVWVRCEGILG